MKKIIAAVLIITILFGCNKNQNNNKALHNSASGYMAVISAKTAEFNDAKSKFDELTALKNDAYCDLKNKSQKFIKSAVDLKEVEINSIKDFDILMNNHLKEASHVILGYGKGSNFDSRHFLIETLFSIMAGFKLDLLGKTVDSLKFFDKVVNSLKFFDVVKLDNSTGQKEKENFCTAAYDSSNQLSKLLHQSYDDINLGNKESESAYKEEAYNKAKDIRDKRRVVYGVENLKAELEASKKTKNKLNLNKAELRAARDTVIELRKQAEVIELQSAIGTDLNSSIRLKKEAKALRDVANEIEKENSAIKKMEENAAAKEMIEADNKAAEMIKKRQAAYKSSYLKIFFGFSVGELKAMEDELKKRRNIKAEYNKTSLLKSSYQKELILLLEKLRNVKNLKVKQAELENALKNAEKNLEDLISWNLLMLQSGYQEYPKKLEAVKSAFTKCLETVVKTTVEDEMKEREKLGSEAREILEAFGLGGMEFLYTFKERFDKEFFERFKKEFFEESLEEFGYLHLLKKEEIYYLVVRSVEVEILKLEQKGLEKILKADQTEFEETLGFKSPKDIEDLKIKAKEIGDLVVKEEKLEKDLETRCTIDEKVLRAGLGTIKFLESEFKDIAFIRNEQKKLAVIKRQLLGNKRDLENKHAADEAALKSGHTADEAALKVQLSEIESLKNKHAKEEKTLKGKYAKDKEDLEEKYAKERTDLENKYKGKADLKDKYVKDKTDLEDRYAKDKADLEDEEIEKTACLKIQQKAEFRKAQQKMETVKDEREKEVTTLTVRHKNARVALKDKNVEKVKVLKGKNEKDVEDLKFKLNKMASRAKEKEDFTFIQAQAAALKDKNEEYKNVLTVQYKKEKTALEDKYKQEIKGLKSEHKIVVLIARYLKDKAVLKSRYEKGIAALEFELERIAALKSRHEQEKSDLATDHAKKKVVLKDEKYKNVLAVWCEQEEASLAAKQVKEAADLKFELEGIAALRSQHANELEDLISKHSKKENAVRNNKWFYRFFQKSKSSKKEEDLKARHEQEEANFKASQEIELKILEDELKELEDLKLRHRQGEASLADKHEQEVKNLIAKHEQEEASLAAGQVVPLAFKHAQELTFLKDRQVKEVVDLQNGQEETDLAAKYKKEEEDLTAKCKKEEEAFATDHAKKEEDLEAKHKKELEDLEAKQAQEKTDLAADHAEEKSDLIKSKIKSKRKEKNLEADQAKEKKALIKDEKKAKIFADKCAERITDINYKYKQETVYLNCKQRGQEANDLKTELWKLSALKARQERKENALKARQERKSKGLKSEQARESAVLKARQEGLSALKARQEKEIESQKSKHLDEIKDIENSYLVKVAALKSKKLNIKERQEKIMNFRAVRDTVAELREQARNFELEAVADTNPKSSIELMTKAVAFRNAANKIVDKNIEYNIAKKEMDIDNYPESELSAIIERRGSIYGADKLLMLKENAERDLYYSYKDYENKDKEALEYQKKTEKIKKELDSMNKSWKNS